MPKTQGVLRILEHIGRRDETIISSDHRHLSVKVVMACPTPQPYYGYLKDVTGARTSCVLSSGVNWCVQILS